MWGRFLNSVEGAKPSDLGQAGKVWEKSLNEEKYTFIEDVPNTFSCTILVKGPDDHTIN